MEIYGKNVLNSDEAGSKVILARSHFSVVFPFLPANSKKYHFCTHKSFMPPDNIPNMLQYWQ